MLLIEWYLLYRLGQLVALHPLCSLQWQNCPANPFDPNAKNWLEQHKIWHHISTDLNIVCNNRNISEVQSSIYFIHHIQWCWLVVMKSKYLKKGMNEWKNEWTNEWMKKCSNKQAIKDHFSPKLGNSVSSLHLINWRYSSSSSLVASHWESDQFYLVLKAISLIQLVGWSLWFTYWATIYNSLAWQNPWLV